MTGLEHITHLWATGLQHNYINPNPPSVLLKSCFPDSDSRILPFLSALWASEDVCSLCVCVCVRLVLVPEDFLSQHFAAII